MSDQREPPPPLEWHSFYCDRTELIEWLNGSPDYPAHEIRLTIPKSVRVDLDDYSTGPVELIELRLKKHKAIGWAPYVGEPFVYAWNFATDQYGRVIAGESRIKYVNPGYWTATELEMSYTYWRMYGDPQVEHRPAETEEL